MPDESGHHTGAVTLDALVAHVAAGLGTPPPADSQRRPPARLPQRVRALRLVPVHGDDARWLVVRSPLLRRVRQTYRLPDLDGELDRALRVDLLLRWIVPPARGEPAASRAERAALDVAFRSPLALLVLRTGAPVVGDADVLWWQSFRQACQIVGRRPAAAYALTARGVTAIAHLDLAAAG